MWSMWIRDLVETCNLPTRHHVPSLDNIRTTRHPPLQDSVGPWGYGQLYQSDADYPLLSLSKSLRPKCKWFFLSASKKWIHSIQFNRPNYLTWCLTKGIGQWRLLSCATNRPGSSQCLIGKASQACKVYTVDPPGISLYTKPELWRKSLDTYR